ncbi:MAG: His/Gly/Thr/Pro-type tRNA ligase C-terminal domain-containing protein, partial [Leptolyngbyaceae cyanobacterium]
VYDNGMTVLVLISIRGDQDVNDTKLYNELTKVAGNYEATTVIALEVPDAEAQQKWAAKSLPLGYINPGLEDDYIQADLENVAPNFLRMVDHTVVDLPQFVTGSNDPGFHVVGATWGSEFELPTRVVDVRTAIAGDRAIHDSTQLLQTARGIEIGHIFQLGTKYSEKMGATFTDEDGKNKPLVMGCYGVGVSRLAQSAVEQSYDDKGIIWPIPIAPYHAMIVVPNINDAEQMEVAETLYASLNAAGVETLLDDRKERAGVKFKDAELVGIPVRIVTGRSLKEGKVEVTQRASGASEEMAIADVVPTIKGWIDAALG